MLNDVCKKTFCSIRAEGFGWQTLGDLSRRGCQEKGERGEKMLATGLPALQTAGHAVSQQEDGGEAGERESRGSTVVKGITNWGSLFTQSGANLSRCLAACRCLTRMFRLVLEMGDNVDLDEEPACRPFVDSAERFALMAAAAGE